MFLINLSNGPSGSGSTRQEWQIADKILFTVNGLPGSHVMTWWQESWANVGPPSGQNLRRWPDGGPASYIDGHRFISKGQAMTGHTEGGAMVKHKSTFLSDRYGLFLAVSPAGMTPWPWPCAPRSRRQSSEFCRWCISSARRWTNMWCPSLDAVFQGLTYPICLKYQNTHKIPTSCNCQWTRQ